MTTIFGEIIAGKRPAAKVYEDDKVIAFKDINPAAPVHILIMPKKEIRGLQALTEADMPLVLDCIRVAQELAEEYGIADGYRLITNNGPPAGQTVFHMHFHLIGGRRLGALA